MKKSTVTIILTLLICILLVSFTLQNAGDITIKLWFWEFKSPIALVLLIVIAISALISILYQLPSNINKKRIIKSKEKDIIEKEREIKILTQKLKELEDREEISDSIADANISDVE
ncbi:MAG: LapA family protein [Bacteroidales bacterium]|nr:LapA family protein [Bacteroidales bacterium]